jgi:phage baseplate assembly protein W
MADRPHFGFPFARGFVVEQDTTDHIASCENVIVRCPVGFRDERPDFGIPWPEFATAPISPSEITAALRRLEPRGNAAGEEYADVADASIRHLSITVEVES